MKNDNISIETAKQLYDLGLRSFSLEYWIRPTKDHWNYSAIIKPVWEIMPYNQGIDSDEEGREKIVKDEFKHPTEFYDVYAAYNFSEIRAIVPYNVEVNENVVEVGYKDTDTETEKWGKLLVYLLKNDMVTLSDIEKAYSNA